MPNSPLSVCLSSWELQVTSNIRCLMVVGDIWAVFWLELELSPQCTPGQGRWLVSRLSLSRASGVSVTSVTTTGICAQTWSVSPVSDQDQIRGDSHSSHEPPSLSHLQSCTQVASINLKLVLARVTQERLLLWLTGACVERSCVHCCSPHEAWHQAPQNKAPSPSAGLCTLPSKQFPVEWSPGCQLLICVSPEQTRSICSLLQSVSAGLMSHTISNNFLITY